MAAFAASVEPVFPCSLHPEKVNAATGKATSRTSKLTKPIIAFKIGGGNHPRFACMILVLDGKVLRTQTGDDSPQLLARSWDVTEFADKTAHIEVRDDIMASAGETTGSPTIIFV